MTGLETPPKQSYVGVESFNQGKGQGQQYQTIFSDIVNNQYIDVTWLYNP